MPRLRRIVPGLLAFSLSGSAQPALGARFLYATASRAGRVDVFPLDGNGGILNQQSTVATAGAQPRRLVVTGCALYAAELDRVEGFRIHKDGRLSSLGTTAPVSRSDPRDIAIGGTDASHQFLYVPQRTPARIVAYPLAADGSPARPTTTADGTQPPWDFASCVQGRPGAEYQAIAIDNALVYVGSVSGQIEAYQRTEAGIAGKVCPEQNPGRLGQGPGTADVLVTELNPLNVQCHPDPRESEQFPVIATTTTITQGGGTTTTTLKSQVSFLHTDPADTGTGLEEGSRLRDLRKQTGDKHAVLSPRVFYTCPDTFTPDRCDAVDRRANPTDREACPISVRRFAGSVQAMAGNGQRLFIDEARARILSSVLLGSDGTFDPFLCKPDKKTKRKDSLPCSPTNLARNSVGDVKGNLVVQTKPASKIHVNPDAGLSSLVFDADRNRLYAPRFGDGTIQSFRVQDVDGSPKVRQSGQSSTKGDLRSSPFRVTIDRDRGVLYVAAGRFNRVQAFQLRGDGKLAATPFSWQDVPDGSFPNDVAVAVPGADCPD